MQILEEERDYFRAEALRLDKISKEQQKELAEMNFKKKILEEDKNYYEEFVINTKKENKKIKNELLELYQQKNEDQPQDLITNRAEMAESKF